MDYIDAEVIDLEEGRFLITVSNVPNALGPFSKRQLQAMREALYEFFDDGGPEEAMEF